MNKSKDLIPLVIAANDKDSAIEVLRKTLEALHLEEDELHLISLKDRLDEFQKDFRLIRDKVRELDYNLDSDRALELRIECNFLFSQVTDEVVFEINKAKILYEERKTVYRAQGLDELRNDQELLAEINPTGKKVSDTALRDNLGRSHTYNRYVNRAGFSYGLYQEVHKLLDGINNLSNSLASITRHRQEIEKKDQK